MNHNKRAEEIVGLRENKGLIVYIDSPQELGYSCPKNKKHDLEWSEYNGFIWCEKCDLDIPSCLCQKDLKKAIEIYLDCLEESKNLTTTKI